MHIVWIYYWLCQGHICWRNLLWYPRKAEGSDSRYENLMYVCTTNLSWSRLSSRNFSFALYPKRLKGPGSEVGQRVSHQCSSDMCFIYMEHNISVLFKVFFFPSFFQDRETFRRTTDPNILKFLGANRPLLQVFRFCLNFG